MLARPFSHCSFCGAGFPEGAPWPRACAVCGNITYRNPLPVAVVLVPVDDGVLAVRRAIPPRMGDLALPSGFINFGETWQEAGAREVHEETGLRLDPAEIQEFHVRSAGDATLIIFGLARPRESGDLPAFTRNAECSERLVLKGPAVLAFPLHEEMLRLFFDGR